MKKGCWTQEKINFLNETRNLLTGEAYKLFCERFSNATSYRAFAVKKSRIGACSCEVKKLKWRPEWLGFINESKGMATDEAYEEFKQIFSDADVTLVAFRNQRSRSKASRPRPHGSNRKKPLFSESESKKYVMIKIAEPNVWISKARWVYETNHPEEIHEKGDQYFFMNGIKNDFTPSNIIKIKARERTLFLQEGGVDSNPEITKINLLKARMKLAQLDLGEKAGFTKQTAAGRKWK